MKRHINNIVLLFLMIGIGSLSCRKLEEFPPEPTIQFMAFEKIFNTIDSSYDRGVLKFSYTDGDGDLGLAKNDTFPPFNFGSRYYYNLVIDYFEVQDGVVKEVPITFYNPNTQTWDTITQSGRIPILIEPGVTKSISGEIFDTLFINNPNSEYDSILFEAYIIDRALNESNVIRTDTIVR